MRREDRSSISCEPLADLGGKWESDARSSLPSFIGAVPLFVPLGSFLRPGPQSCRAPRAGAVKTGRPRRPPTGLVLTAPSTVPRSCRLGRSGARPDAFECALLVENCPCNAGKLIGKRDRPHVVVQSLFGGVDPGFEPIPVGVLVLTSTTRAACTNRARR